MRAVSLDTGNLHQSASIGRGWCTAALRVIGKPDCRTEVIAVLVEFVGVFPECLGGHQKPCTGSFACERHWLDAVHDPAVRGFATAAREAPASEPATLPFGNR